MANLFGYNQLFSVNPELWVSQGKITVAADGYTVASSNLPASLVSGLTHNGTGDYTLVLSQCWPAGVASISSEKATGFGYVQLVSDNIGTGAAGTQGFRFSVLDAAGSPANLASGDRLAIVLTLQRTTL